MGFFHLEKAKVWEQNRVRLFLSDGYLNGYEEIIKENSVFLKINLLNQTH